jgi:hypothetical protein
MSGLLTDELLSGDLGQQGYISSQELIDSRRMREYGGAGDDSTTAGEVNALYSLLQRARGQSRESRGALATFIPTGSNELQGHLDALEAYSDVYLADVFCSGIPLSTLDYGKDFTYQPGSTTLEVYKRAVALFDSAITLAADSDHILNFARIGRARAQLALGNYSDAAATVSSVPDDYQYILLYDVSQSPGPNNAFINHSFAFSDFDLFQTGLSVTMSDREGINGLAYRSSNDPRTPWVDDGLNQHDRLRARPAKYSLDGSGPVVIASGVEARLIQAEAALQSGGSGWLDMLNALRTDGTFETQQDPDDANKTDTLWHAGTGGVAGLAPLDDPGTADTRLTLLFHERAFWLYLTGIRQGDLRRLVRQYGRQVSAVYPVGSYPGAFNAYGTDVNAPVPGAERISNPLYGGCQGRGA